MDQVLANSVEAFLKARRRRTERMSKAALAAVELVFDRGPVLMAAVRAGQVPIDTLRTELETVLPKDGAALRSALGWTVRAIDYWAEERLLELVRTEPLHWSAVQIDGGKRTYLLRAELDLSRQVDTGHAVMLATTEEPRRFARFLLRHYVGRRPVYLWTVASGLFRVGGSADALTFVRPGSDAESFSVDGGYRRLSAFCDDINESPEDTRLMLVASRGYDAFRTLTAGGSFITGFVKQTDSASGLTIDLIVDDLAEGAATLSEIECRALFDAMGRQLRERRAEAAWSSSEKQYGPFLDEIKSVMSVKPANALFVLLDGNIFLESRGGETTSFAPTFLKDASARLRRARTGTQIVVLSTPLTMTRALTDELECVELPLPSRNEITVALRRLLEKNGITVAAAAAVEMSDEMSMLGDAAAGMTLQDVASAVRRACAEGSATIPGVLEELQQGKQAAVKRSPALELVDELPSGRMFLGGLEKLVEWLGVRRRVFERPEQAKQFGIERRPKGILLLGIPGTGKSLAAKIIAREWKLPLVRLDMGALRNAYVGASEQRIREALRIVEAMSPCILWIDEIDKGVAQGEGTSSHSVDLNIRATLLTWLQESCAAVFCVATANRFANLPPELTRAGRFDARFFLGCPNEKGRTEILDIHLAVRGIVIDDEAKKSALSAMHGFTGAEIEQAVLDGLYAAFADGRQLVADDIIQAASTVKPIVRAIGKGLDEVWALVDEGRVELASDDFLTRSDLAKLIDPTLFSPMYCRLESIGGWEKHATRAQRMLMADPAAPRAAAMLSTGDPDWIYVQLNVPFADEDKHPFKFLDQISTVERNGILDVFVAELGVEVFYIESQELADRLGKESGFSGYAEIFKPQPRSE